MTLFVSNEGQRQGSPNKHAQRQKNRLSKGKKRQQPTNFERWWTIMWEKVILVTVIAAASAIVEEVLSDN